MQDGSVHVSTRARTGRKRTTLPTLDRDITLREVGLLMDAVQERSAVVDRHILSRHQPITRSTDRAGALILIGSMLIVLLMAMILWLFAVGTVVESDDQPATVETVEPGPAAPRAP